MIRSAEMNASQKITVIPCECGGTLYNEIDIRVNSDWIECANCGRKTSKRRVYVAEGQRYDRG